MPVRLERNEQEKVSHPDFVPLERGFFHSSRRNIDGFPVCFLLEIAYNRAVSRKANGVMGIERKG